MNLDKINSKNSESITGGNKPVKIKRRNFFVYLGAGALGFLALKNLPFKLFQQKVKNEAGAVTGIRIKSNPYAVKRDMRNGRNDAKGNLNG